MNIKRIISSVLTVVMIITSLAVVMPTAASAAYIGSSSNMGVAGGVDEANLNKEELADYIKEYLVYDFETAEEMLEYELSKGYLYYVNSSNYNSSALSQYTLFVNKYTGFVYYRNNYTGQILTSNPINPGYKIGSSSTPSINEPNRIDLMSQLVITFFETSNSQNKTTYTSVDWAASRGQISVSAIANGFRVNYTLGDTTIRFLLPGMIKTEDFDRDILKPILDKYAELLEEHCSKLYPDVEFSFFENEDYYPYVNGYINSKDAIEGVPAYLSGMAKYFAHLSRSNKAVYEQLREYMANIQKLLSYYALKDPTDLIDSDRKKDQEALADMYKNYPITKEGVSVYVYSSSATNAQTENAQKRIASGIIQKYCPEYTFAMMYKAEADCKYVDKSAQKPVFRCALEYTFNEDGSLSARLPASSITFDESVYTLESITPLKYFGCGNMTNDGYIFYPDGSGAVIKFEDFYNEPADKKINLSLSSQIYGYDYCYSKITGAHREQITMPVYGLVSETLANSTTKNLFLTEDKVTNGFFAIIEEGSSLANLEFKSGGVSHRFATAYALYKPYPSDEYDLSDTISVGSLGTYTIVSDSKYTGSYVTRYVMLTDEEVGKEVYGENAFYKSGYVGMAAYYRDYLKKNGVLSALEVASTDLPLYIEVLGAMDIIDRFLTFPVTKSIPLTTFDDVAKMYEELSKCEEYIAKKANEYLELAAKQKDEAQKYYYEQLAKQYSELDGVVDSIKNINFKLTGFANGGVKSTYPVKLRWEKAVGGKSGYKSLINAAAAASKEEGYSFAIYPEFDFMYINYTSMFDGISKKGNASKMVDNRYASKQVYNSVLQEYESFFKLVISADSLDSLFGKFNKKFSKYSNTNISVSTLGSDLNSNFDSDNPFNRDESMAAVQSLLDKMANQNEYSIMVDKGNAYTLEYVDHILNASIDSSHLRYSSYTVPFVGMVLHSYVNYTGAPINYSGSPQYDLLRSIESGASLYYILCFGNTSHMKDDKDLNKYYGVDYQNWYGDILVNYKALNDQIGGLQSYEIVDHKTLLCERVIDGNEEKINFVRLQDEIIEMLDYQILLAIDKAYIELKADASNFGKRLKVDVTDENRNALMAQFAGILNVEASELENTEFSKKVDAVIAKYESKYNGAATEANTRTINFSEIVYESKYTYITDSFAEDKNYVYTDYTCDNGNVVMVTYKKGNHEVKFIINYNNYPVDVKLDSEHVFENIPKYGFVRFEEVK